jgi:tRNA(fMet)-specific endonuclease VapC
MFILDTDHVSLWLRGHPLVKDRTIQARPNVATTVVTVQELFNGWAGRINNLTREESLVFAYTNLWQTIDFIQQFPIANFDQGADDCYVNLLEMNVELRKKKLSPSALLIHSCVSRFIEYRSLFNDRLHKRIANR